MKKTILTIALMQFIFCSHAQLNLDQCQEKSNANYPLIKQYDLISKSTEYTSSNVNKAYLPQVSVTGIGAYFISGLPSISLPGAPSKESNNFKFIGIVIAEGVYHIVPVGSLWVLYGFLSIYLFAILGFGLLMSTYSSTQQQAMSLSFHCH